MTHCSHPGKAADLVVALLRLWSHARRRHANPLPAMYARGLRAGAGQELVAACESCFLLTEACLGRRLIAGAAAAGPAGGLTRDEAALLLMLRHAPAVGPACGSAAIPHGLPGALGWACFAVLRALGDDMAAAPDRPDECGGARQCPFDLPVAQAA
jgi:hypothetical protein